MLDLLQEESDSSNLYYELIDHYFVSTDLRKFLDVWYAEELNHAAGYCKMLHILFGENEDYLMKNVQSKKADFTGMGEFFNDEFKLCLLFAYEEYSTSLYYRKNTFYKLFGPIEFVEWIQRVSRDEARHGVNAIKLIHHKHKHRIHEAPKVLEQILELEGRLGLDPKFTFLFDHTEDLFSIRHKDMKKNCMDQVLKSVGVLPR